MTNVAVIVLLLLALNACTFIVMRMAWVWDREGLSADIIIPRQQLRTEDERELVILGAGNLAQAKGAFEFMQPLLRHKQCAYLQFRSIGWSARGTALRIVRQFGYQYDHIIFYGISLGDRVARYLDSTWLIDNLENYDVKLDVYGINPCPCPKVIRTPYRILLTVLAPIFYILCHALGWLSIIPIIPVPKGRYSLMLLADQYFELAFDFPPVRPTNTRGIILSDRDEMLKNQALRKIFMSSRHVWIDSGHGDTIRKADEYLDGVKRLLATSDD